MVYRFGKTFSKSTYFAPPVPNLLCMVVPSRLCPVCAYQWPKRTTKVVQYYCSMFWRKHFGVNVLTQYSTHPPTTVSIIWFWLGGALPADTTKEVVVNGHCCDGCCWLSRRRCRHCRYRFFAGAVRDSFFLLSGSVLVIKLKSPKYCTVRSIIIFA